MYKQCTRCQTDKPATVEYFIKDNRNKSGIGSACRVCVNKKARETYYEKIEERHAYYKTDRAREIVRKSKSRPEYKRLHRMSEQRRRALARQLPHDLTVEEYKDTLEYFNHSCAYCGLSGIPLQQDHVIPVIAGGGYVKDNIVPACSTCNQSKGGRDMEAWYVDSERFTITRYYHLLLFKEAYRDERDDLVYVAC